MKKVILITGSSTGFGALMAKTFSGEGHTVIASMRDVTGKNAGAAATLSSLPGTEVVDLDVTDEDSVQTAVTRIISAHSKIDVVINNAGIYGGGLLEAFSVSQVQKLFDVNVWGVLRVNNAVLPAMRAAGDGLIINISSGVGRISPPFQAAYNATKFALEGLIEGSYHELIGQGIETVLVEPGAFLTEIMGKPGTNADRDGIQESYGSQTAEMAAHIQSLFVKILTDAAPDPQLVADAALSLVNMKKGKRPFRTPVDPNAKGMDTAYNNATIEWKDRWMAAYGF